MKKISLILFTAFFVFSQRSSATQLFSWFEVTPNHVAYSAGQGFNPNEEFIRGFCFAFEGVSPITNGYSINVYQASYVTGTINQVTFNYIIISYPITVASSYLYACYLSIVGKLDNIPAGDERNFWLGYAELLLQASYNPTILYMNQGQVF